MKETLERLWWRAAPPPRALQALVVIYAAVADSIAARRRSKAQRLPVPVIVVGNIAIGGTGKTPVTLALLELLQSLGKRPGVLSRGYGGAGPFPLLVNAQTPPTQCGDEPLLIAQRGGVPVAVAPSRFAAGQTLLAAHPELDVLVCDDGLQHYALARDLELCVVDGQRGHGNGHRLPAGPLREPPSRLAACDLVLVNGGDAAPYGAQALRFDLQMDEALALRDTARRPLSAFVGQSIDAMAGIGHPARFFAQLTAQGLMVHPHVFADHQAYTAADLDFTSGRPLLMTEKDAVKCRALSLPPDLDAWVVPVRAVFAGNGAVRMRECLRALFNRP